MGSGFPRNIPTCAHDSRQVLTFLRKSSPSFVEIEKRIGSQRKQKRSANAPGERTIRLCKNVVRVKQPPLASR
jgi:hypothetical protein